MAAERIYDVAVIGGGNAGISAALTARGRGASVVVLECAPRHFRGGNSRHTRNLRCAHPAPTEWQAEAYTDEEFLYDLLRVSGSGTDETLARILVRHSTECMYWMQRHGARFQPPLRGTLHLARSNAFFLGGGKALLNAYYAAAERLGVHVRYGAEVTGLELAGEQFVSASSVYSDGRTETVHARAAVLAAGGFEANIDWLRETWGDAANDFIVRGTPYNTGRILKLMLEAGAQSVADAKECHAVAVDARAPKFDGGIVTRLDCVPFGIVVNTLGQRFADEGEDFWPRRYATWGRLVAQQPRAAAYAIIDAKAIGRFIPSAFPPIVADSIRELASRLGVPAEALHTTVSAFNQAVGPGAFDHTVLDDCRTVGLEPGKSHWAQRLDTPPFWGYPVRPGITFTYLGLRIDSRGRVLMGSGQPASNIYAAGEIMAGNILRQGYVAGAGMTIGTVFGRLAGGEAARHARG
jgi:tricarballylate dehydrogenase